MTETNGAMVLTTRKAEPPTPAPASATEALDIEMRRAQAISNAVQALPDAYRKQPGAVLLVDQWARSHGVDTLTAIQTVTFFKGKPIVAADMQRALATKAGYEVDITEGEGWAELTVTRNGKSKSARFTLEEAQRAGLTKKDVWKHYQSDMLVARATARCLRRHAPEVVLGLADPDEIDTPMDVLQAAAVAAPVEGVEQENAAAAPAPPPASDDDPEIVDAEIVEEVEDTGAGPVGEPPPPPEPEKDTRTAAEISGNPEDAIFDNPPATSIPKPATAKAQVEEIETPAAFKARIRTDYPGWSSVSLLKAMAAAGRSASIDEILASPDLYKTALDLLEAGPPA